MLKSITNDATKKNLLPEKAAAVSRGNHYKVSLIPVD
jgi:hypothetical protein